MTNDVTGTAHDRTRALNDELRVQDVGGSIVVTAGLAALGEDTVVSIRRAVAMFDQFNSGNDPYGEHDCAVMDFSGERLIWKIDYYDERMTGHSTDPTDAGRTRRVLTIMLASEY